MRGHSVWFGRAAGLRRVWRCTLAGYAALMVAGCGGSDGSAATTSPSTVASPAVINLYPVAGSSGTGAVLYVLVKAVGDHSGTFPMLFDTGSAGITINALSIFPSSMVTSSGFVFSPGETSITYQGITVTDQQGTHGYGGGSTATTYTGNIGYATVTFGDGQGALTTQVMPMFLYYEVTATASGEVVSEAPQQGIFGVRSVESNPIAIEGTTKPAGGYPACAQGTTGTCWLDSVFKHLTFADGIDAGFLLTPATLQTCDIAMSSSCTGAGILTVGLTAPLEDGFSQQSMTCPPAGFDGPATIGSYPVCQAAIAGTTITSSSGSSLTRAVVWDTGTSGVAVTVPEGATFTSTAGQPIDFTLPNGFVYTLAPGGPGSVYLLNDSNADSIVGIPYFTTNSFFTDFTLSTEGWK